MKNHERKERALLVFPSN